MRQAQSPMTPTITCNQQLVDDIPFIELVDSKVYSIQSILLNSPNEDEINEAKLWFQPRHYDEIVEERVNDGKCGYPRCHSALCKVIPSVPSLKINYTHKRLYEVDNSFKYCSEKCCKVSSVFVSQLETSNPASRDVAIRLYSKNNRVLRPPIDCNDETDVTSIVDLTTEMNTKLNLGTPTSRLKKHLIFRNQNLCDSENNGVEISNVLNSAFGYEIENIADTNLNDTIGYSPYYVGSLQNKEELDGMSQTGSTEIKSSSLFILLWTALDDTFGNEYCIRLFNSLVDRDDEQKDSYVDGSRSEESGVEISANREPIEVDKIAATRTSFTLLERGFVTAEREFKRVSPCLENCLPSEYWIFKTKLLSCANMQKCQPLKSSEWALIALIVIHSILSRLKVFEGVEHHWKAGVVSAAVTLIGKSKDSNRKLQENDFVRLCDFFEELHMLS